MDAVSPEASSAVANNIPVERPDRSPAWMWIIGALPLVLLAGLLAFVMRGGPGDTLKGNAPPVENLAITQVRLQPGTIELSVLNDGPDEVTIAQVVVDDAFWAFQASPRNRLAHLQRARISIPYPWVTGETHVVRLLTSSGLTFEREIPVAVETPTPNAQFLGTFALIGLYVGVIPVALGLLWYPLMSRIGRTGLQFLLALTVGLLVYLLVDSAHDGLEAAAVVPGSLQGPAIFVFGGIGAFLTLDLIGAWLAKRRSATVGDRGAHVGWILAMLIAVGIGLHNFGEGLAIGSAFSLGELGLGTLLIVGFTLHNTTEGLAIVAPLARRAEERIGLARLVQLGLIGGLPTILGAWIGAFVYSSTLAVFFLALGVGAIAQVTRQIVMQSARERGVAAYLREGAVVAGLATGVAIMYVTGMIVG
jgi:zinc transporter ZupT